MVLIKEVREAKTKADAAIYVLDRMRDTYYPILERFEEFVDLIKKQDNDSSVFLLETLVRDAENQIERMDDHIEHCIETWAAL